MDSTLKLILGEATPGAETRTYTIKARPQDLDKIEQLLAWMNMTAGGHSGSASISIDGDGAARIQVEKKDGKLSKHDYEDNEAWSGKTEFHVGLD